MLSYALAIAVALSSLVLFSTAFIMPDIHRQDDFFWSGIGLFYALVLWFCARNITGAVLLGQAAAASLLVSYNWQTLKLRKAIANPDKASTTKNFSVLQTIKGLLKRNQLQAQNITPSTTTTITDKVTEADIAIPEQTSQTTQSPESNNQSEKSLTEPKQPSLTNTKLDQVLAEETTAKTQPDMATSATEANKIKDATAAKVTTNQTEEEVVNTPKTPPEPQIQEDSEPSPEKIADKQDEQNSSSENTVATTTVNPENPSAISPNNQPEPNLSNPSEEAKTETPSPETTTQTPTTQPEKKPSALDSLETVEIAEILEASSEGRFGNRESETIIEVTTTEVEITIEEKTEPNQGQDDDSEPPQPV